MMMLDCSLLYRAAWHESGHAVAALCFGLPLLAVEIRENGGGVTRYDPSGLPRHTAESRCVTGYAGAEAELSAFPFLDTRPGDIGDVRGIHKMLAALDLRWLESDLAVLRAQARELVECERGAIRDVAAALIQFRRLSGDQVEQVARIAWAA